MKGLGQDGQLAHRGIVGAVSRKRGRLAFDGGAHLVETDHVRQVQVQDIAAALPRVGDDKADLRQLGDRLGHRGAGNAQRGRDLIDVQSCAGRDVQRDDLVIDELADEVAQLGLRLGVHIVSELIAIHRPLLLF